MKQEELETGRKPVVKIHTNYIQNDEAKKEHLKVQRILEQKQVK